jgi:capsular polysaccharide biosynthesis protein
MRSVPVRSHAILGAEIAVYRYNEPVPSGCRGGRCSAGMPRDTANGGIMEMFEGQPRDLDEGPGLLQSVWQYNWLIAIGALLGALLGYGWQARQPTLYEGSTRLLLSIGNGVLPGDPTAPLQEPQRFLSNQAQVIASRPVLQGAAKGRTTVGNLRRRMTVEVAKDADVITIRVRDVTAQGAADLAQALGVAYNEFVIKQSAQNAAIEVKQLEAAADNLNAQLEELAAALGADPDNQILQARQAAVKQQLTDTVAQSERLAHRARNGVTPVRWQEPAAVPQQPVQPAPRRGAMAGLLLGLVGAAALAWWLNIRAMKQQMTERERHNGSRAWSEVPPVPSESPLGQETAGERKDAVPAAGNGAYPGQTAPLVRPRDRQVSPWLDAERVSAFGGRPTATDAAPIGRGGDDLRSIFDRLEATLGSEPLDWYLDNFPQFMAEQLTTKVRAEMVAVLLDRAEGSFAVAGGFGLTAEEQGAIVDQSHDVLRQSLMDGVGILQEGTDRTPTVAAGLPGSQTTQALVMVPLVEGSSWLGMLLVGRRSANGQHVASFNDQELERIIMYAMEIAPTLQTLILLNRLQGAARSLEMSRNDQAEPAAG